MEWMINTNKELCLKNLTMIPQSQKIEKILAFSFLINRIP